MLHFSYLCNGDSKRPDIVVTIALVTICEGFGTLSGTQEHWVVAAIIIYVHFINFFPLKLKFLKELSEKYFISLPHTPQPITVWFWLLIFSKVTSPY